MEFNSSYFHTFGNPDFAAVFSGGSTQALRPCPSASDGAGVKAEKGAGRHTVPSSVFFVLEEELEEAQHFLDQCSRCRKFLTGDIFMYRGDTPFCSDQCRRKQIEMEKTRHRRKQQNSPKAQVQMQGTAAAQNRDTAPQLRRLQPQ